MTSKRAGSTACNCTKFPKASPSTVFTAPSCSARQKSFELIEQEIDSLPPVVILRLRNMTAIDATGLHALESISDRLRKTGRHVILCGARSQPRRMMARAEFKEHFGEKNICKHVSEALRRARELRDGNLAA